MMFLVDTDVLWQLRGAADVDAVVMAWASRQQRSALFVSALALLELGTAADEIARGDKQAGVAIRQWAEQRVLPAFEGRILPVDAKVASRAARIAHTNPVDGLVAATALEHGLVLATRTPTAFRTARVKLLDPGRSGDVDPDGEGDGDWRQAARGGPVWLRSLFARG